MRRGALIAAAIGLLALVATTPAHAAASQASSTVASAPRGTFSATASADVVRANLAIPNYLLIKDFVDGGGPSAQAVMDSLGTSKAFASFPYPGETGVAATGLISTLTGLSLPTYPFVATSDYPTTPTAAIDQPGYHMDATSGESSSKANATFGETTTNATNEGGSVAEASVTVDDAGTVTARSAARFGLKIGPVSLRGIDASAQMVRTIDGHVTPTSTFAISSVDIAGVALQLTDKGLVLAGAPLLPVDAFTGLASALSIGQTKVEYLPATTTDDSITSAGLRITTSQMVDAIGHPVDIAYTIGNLYAAATSTAFPTAVVPSVGPIAPSAPLPLTGSAPTGSAFTPAPSARPSGNASIAGPVATPVSQSTSHRTGIPLSLSAWSFFPVLVLAGAVLVAGPMGTRLTRRGARRWS